MRWASFLTEIYHPRPPVIDSSLNLILSLELYVLIAFLTLADNMMPDLGNCHLFGMNRQGPCRGRISRPDMTFGVGVLSKALDKACNLEPQIVLKILRRLGSVLTNIPEFENARLIYSEAIGIDEQLEGRSALSSD